jgi:hypothetical protein
MRTFIYTYHRKKNDRNGNPRHYINALYRVKRNKPVLVASGIDIGYRDKVQAVIDTLVSKKQIPRRLANIYSTYTLREEHQIDIICV